MRTAYALRTYPFSAENRGTKMPGRHFCTTSNIDFASNDALQQSGTQNGQTCVKPHSY